MLRSLIERLVKAIVALARRIFGHDDGSARLKPVSNLEIIVMAKNLLLKWKNPTERVDGEAVQAGELKAVEIYARQSAIPDFTKVATVTDGSESRSLPSVPSGTWIFRLVAIDSDNVSADPAEGSITVPRAALKAVSDVTVEVVE